MSPVLQLTRQPLARVVPRSKAVAAPMKQRSLWMFTGKYSSTAPLSAISAPQLHDFFAAAATPQQRSVAVPSAARGGTCFRRALRIAARAYDGPAPAARRGGSAWLAAERGSDGRYSNQQPTAGRSHQPGRTRNLAGLINLINQQLRSSLCLAGGDGDVEACGVRR